MSYSRAVDRLGPEASDEAITEYAESEGLAILSTDVKDFGRRDAEIPLFVVPQGMTGGDVRAAIARVEALPFDPAETDPIWLSSL